MNVFLNRFDYFVYRLTIEPVYLYYDYEEAYIRTEPNGGNTRYFVKFQGQREFEDSIETNDVVLAAVMEYNEITKAEYDAAFL